MADTPVQENNVDVKFKGAPVKEKAVPDKKDAKPDKRNAAKSRAKKLLRSGAISKKQHDKMIGSFAPAAPAAPLGGDPELDMGAD